MSDAKLGTLIDETARRDAIHVAIAPMIAACELEPGQRVGKGKNGTASRDAREHIGIVDPFLPEPVNAGERFYVVLFPGTVTGMRHEWSHPAFPSIAERVPEPVAVVDNDDDRCPC